MAGSRVCRADAVVVGSGAGGAPLACRLSEAGFDVLVLEKGPRYERGDYRHDEIHTALNPAFFVPSTDDDPHVLIDVVNGGASRRTTLGWIASCLGGGTTHMGGALYRFHPLDFAVRSHFGDVEAVADWPYSYDEIERYYTRAEWELGVSGACGNPFEGPRSAAYPMPPLVSHPLASRVDAACRRLGLHSFATPRAINSVPYDGRPACEYCEFCAGHGCPVGARGSMPETFLQRAEGTGRCRIMAGAMVREILLDQRGLASGCIFIDGGGAEHRVHASLVCVSCSAVESARLLMLSTSPRFPNGLCNHFGLVGRNLQFHSRSAAKGRVEGTRLSNRGVARRRGVVQRSVMDYYLATEPPSSSFAKGGTLKIELERTYPLAMAQSAAVTEGGRLCWGSELKQRLRETFQAGRELGIEIHHDFLPNTETRVSLSAEVKDKWGLPAAAIHLSPSSHHERIGKSLVARAEELLGALGASDIRPDGIGTINGAMAHGTCRAGRGEQDSVLNSYCQAHAVANLFVLDGSFMPTSGGVPTTLTIVANSLRAADFIISERSRLH